MENPAAAPPPRPPERLRWLDLVPVLLFTVLGVILVIALVVTLARLSRSFYQANLATIGLTAALGGLWRGPRQPGGQRRAAGGLHLHGSRAGADLRLDPLADEHGAIAFPQQRCWHGGRLRAAHPVGQLIRRDQGDLLLRHPVDD